MALEYTVEPLPAVWPGKKTANPRRSPFKTQWTAVLRDLEREIRHLGGRRVVIHCDVQGRHLRNDGQLRSDASPGYPVIVAFTERSGARLVFPCDTFAFWQDNVSAIARALEALRMVDRYGVQQGKQYEGFKALPGATSATLSTQEASEIIAEHSGGVAPRILTDRAAAAYAIRVAVGRTHPDRNNGERTDYDRVEAAKHVLTAHYGGKL